jgi:hypothetical protein
MPVYSHSQLSTYEECPLKYALCYWENVKRDVEGIKALLGKRQRTGLVSSLCCHSISAVTG